jgi:predicted RNA-binding Zn-ribbon protein involved in translation (DUF1610 family)
MSSSQFDAQSRGVNIICPKCGAIGVVLWENENNEGHTLVSLSKNFYERMANKKPYSIELVCDSCGAAQPEKLGQREYPNQEQELGQP